ncbi:MAG: alkaline phosphatase D family protein [Cryomorphaceae bacterium]
MIHRSFILLVLTFISCLAYGQRIQSGPMPGYASMNSVGIWLQLTDSADVKLRYWDLARPTNQKVIRPTVHDVNVTEVAQFHATGLEPGTDYGYEILINGVVQDVGQSLAFHTEALWQYREDPPTTRIALGSCSYINEGPYDRPGVPYGSNYQIFDSIAAKDPDVMLWLGDHIYLREYDLGSKSGYFHRYSHTRATPAMQKLLRGTHHYAIWDDHDFGPNDANGSWIHKDWALEAFKLFWMNPSYGIPGQPGITTAFEYNDVDFFLLDNRWNRTSDHNKQIETHILGKDQIEWLIEALKFSRAPFKLVAVGGQVLNPAKVFENHAQYAEEREYLLTRIVEEKIKGVIFLTGDRHHTELRKASRDNIDIYDLTVSPLTSGVHQAKNESSEYLIEKTQVNEHNFGLLEISGERLARQLKISIFDKEGSELWTKMIYP